LEEWVLTYPNDFATPGTHGAITALVKQIASNPCTLHYAAEILPFLDDDLPLLRDLDMSWGMPCEDVHESDDDDFDDGENCDTLVSMSETTTPSTDTNGNDVSYQSIQRDRKSSLPLSTKSMVSMSLTTTISGQSSQGSRPYSKNHGQPKNSLKDFVRLSQTLATYDPLEVAQQITKLQSDLFLAIEVCNTFLKSITSIDQIDVHFDPAATTMVALCYG
jgi:hypothetical protein